MALSGQAFSDGQTVPGRAYSTVCIYAVRNMAEVLNNLMKKNWPVRIFQASNT
jgi:hypothetical protein